MNHAPSSVSSISSVPTFGVSRVAVIVAVWASLSVALATSGALALLPRPVIPLLIWSPVVAGVIAYRRGGAMRTFVLGLDPRALVLLHVLRVYFGACFLVDAAAGRLAARFADIAGPGDIAAGLLALPVVLIAARPSSTARTLTLAWNVLGLADILLVFVTAQRMLLIERDTAFLRAFQALPYAALPTFVVPLILATHLALFARLRAPHSAA